MNLHLGGWQRIGIVASVLWAIGAGLVARSHDASEASYMYRTTYDICIDKARAQQQPTKGAKPLPREIVSGCHEQGWKSYQLALEGSWKWVLFIALVPIPIGWLLVYMVVGVWRWVRRGFIKAI